MLLHHARITEIFFEAVIFEVFELGHFDSLGLVKPNGFLLRSRRVTILFTLQYSCYGLLEALPWPKCGLVQRLALYRTPCV